MERLQKFMAHAGVASRRKSEKIIKQGRVIVNDNVIIEPGFKIDPVKDVVKVDDEVIEREKLKYLVLNKPAGYVTTTDDPMGRPTVMDLIKIKERVYPVGRLDYDTTGLLFLTNDGEVANLVMHPNYEIDKEYLVTIDGNLNEQDLVALREGIRLSDGKTAPAEAEVVVDYSNTTILKMVIHEGRKNQIKRMIKQLDYEVKELKRIRVGPLELDASLKEGSYRHLTAKEKRGLKQLNKE